MKRVRSACSKYVILAFAAAALVGPADAGAAMKGTVPDITWGIPRAEVDRTIALMRDAGVRTIRANVGWSAVERDGKGVYNEGWLAEIDYAIGAARAAGIEVLMPISDGVPYWASADPQRGIVDGKPRWNVYYRPRDYDDYGDFVRWAVHRYKVLGVRAYEIWNEPNHRTFWPSGPNAGEYVQMLRAGHAAVKQADPGATVVLGGLAGNDYRYLEQVYELGGGGFFDVAAVHPYTAGVDPMSCWTENGSNAEEAWCGIETVRDVMVRNGDAAKELWLTEYGWSSSPAASWSVDEATQAAFVTNAFRWLESRPYVTRAYYYGFRNLYWSGDDPRDWGANLGLLRTDYTAKPAYEAFKAYTGARPEAPPPTVTPPAAASAAASPPAAAAPPAPAPAASPPAPAAATVEAGGTAAGSAPPASAASRADSGAAPSASVRAAAVRVNVSVRRSGTATFVRVTSPRAAILHVRLNGRLIATARRKSFSVRVRVRRGAHVVTVRAVTRDGRSSTTTFRFRR